MPQTDFDRFDRNADTLSSPARDAFAIAPNDSTPLPILPKAILVGAGGTITLRAIDSGTDVAIETVAGQILPIRAEFVRATGTSAGSLVGLA